mgnify:CR=1 FL=1
MTFDKILASFAAAGVNMGPAFGMTVPVIELQDRAFGSDVYRA